LSALIANEAYLLSVKKAAVLFSMLALFLLPPFAAAQQSKTYTTTGDFGVGTLFNTSNTDVADQLQISKIKTTYPVMWIANAGEDTVSKVDTNTGATLAKYRTVWNGYKPHPGNAWDGAAPSRTAVDQDGNLYVANRHFESDPCQPPSVIKILASGGIDRNGDGVITTSTSGTDLKDVIDHGTLGTLDIADFSDERVAWVAVLPAAECGNLGRSRTG
jgi:hypothetical protein